MKNFKLHPVTHNIVIEDGQFVMVEEGEAVVQAVKCNLLLQKGEWFLNLNLGTDWLNFIFSTEVTQEQKNIAIKSAITKVPEVRALTAFEFELDSELHTATIVYSADTIYGVLSEEITLNDN